MLCTAEGGVTPLNCEVSSLDGIEWSVSRPSHLTVQEDSLMYPSGFKTRSGLFGKEKSLLSDRE
jgi:hypothetical protein